MGMMKHQLEEKYALYGLAANILEQVGAIKICEVHGYSYLLDETILVEAYKLGNFMISKGVFGCGRRELTDAIKDVQKMTPEECPGCSNAMYDDD